jgi:hypothetical protein
MTPPRSKNANEMNVNMKTTPEVWREQVSAKVRDAVVAAAKIQSRVVFNLRLGPTEGFPEQLAGSLREHNAVFNTLYELSVARIFEQPDYLSISIRCDEIVFPLENRRIYNLWRCCREGIKLELFPGSGPTLLVTGVTTRLPVESLTGPLLLHATGELSSSQSLALDLLLRERGDDYWKMHGGDDV